MQKNPNLLTVVIILAILVPGFILYNSIFTVQSGYKAIVFNFGSISEIRDEGLNFKIPIVQSYLKVDVRTQKAEGPASAASRDMQSVQAKITLNYHLDPTKLADTYTRFGLDIDKKIINPRIQEVIKAVTAKFSAEELLTKRELVKIEISNQLTQSVSRYNVIVEDIQITNFEFSNQFNDAIEAKQTAEQNALRAKNDLDRIIVEAEQKVTMARAEAEAIRIQSEAVRAQGGESYVRLKAIEKWDGKLPHYTGAGPMPFLEVK
jgi:regulator of protease activity HflC (stomatin/prohibitin superfamily)